MLLFFFRCFIFVLRWCRLYIWPKHRAQQRFGNKSLFTVKLIIFHFRVCLFFCTFDSLTFCHIPCQSGYLLVFLFTQFVGYKNVDVQRSKNLIFYFYFYLWLQNGAVSSCCCRCLVLNFIPSLSLFHPEVRVFCTIRRRHYTRPSPPSTVSCAVNETGEPC